MYKFTRHELEVIIDVTDKQRFGDYVEEAAFDQAMSILEREDPDCTIKVSGLYKMCKFYDII